MSMAARLTIEAHFDAGLKKVCDHLLPHRASHLWHYFLSRATEPQFVVDVSHCYEIKRAAIMAHKTQFGQGRDIQKTFLNAGPGSFLSIIESRDCYYGSLMGCQYGEGFITAILWTFKIRPARWG
mgnify:CR=1 FL=1